ncbi:HAD family phosphatase [Candidatus Woesearchaeota archaeon]|nr:HAD family phosphatase [Candidatus Woesearchaeota archaeon]
MDKNMDIQINAVIFDMDGLLVNSEPIHYKAWKKTLEGYGIVLTYKMFLDYVGQSNEALVEDQTAKNSGKQTEIKDSVEEVIKIKNNNYIELIDEIELMPNVRETVEKLSHQYPLVVASSSYVKEVTEILLQRGIADFFKVIIGGDMVVEKKPHPEIYLKAAEVIGVNPEECLALEDSESGLRAAKSAGMYAIAVPNEYTKKHDFSIADKVIKNISEVIEVVKSDRSENSNIVHDNQGDE